jgi:allantoin racemase
MKIWVQSFTDLTALPGYRAMLAEYAERVCSPGTHVDVHGVRPGTYPSGMAPGDISDYAWPRHLVDIQIVENIVRAEREGYDAVAVSCFADPGLEMARSLVDIPVVSSCETALLVASTVGRRFGLLAHDKGMAHILEDLVAGYGFEGRVGAVSFLDPPLTEIDIDGAFNGSREFTERMAADCRALIARGADVIIPAEGALNIALVRNGLQVVDGVPVLDSYGALLGMAELLVRMRQTSGLTTGRNGRYARPHAAIVRHLSVVTSSVLEEAGRVTGAR